MATCLQGARRKIFKLKPGLKYKNPTLSRTPILKRCPQVSGIVDRVVTRSPKKPNSAVRHVVQVDLSNDLRLTARLPGKDYHPPRYAKVLVRGGRANDLPGIGYTAIRGAYDFSGVIGKVKRRSYYGIKRAAGSFKHVRRYLRK